MISNRLRTIASFVPNNTNVADIGSDHGYLLMQLFDSGHSGFLLGVENKKGPFETLKFNVNKNKYKNKINISYSNGLNDVTNDYSTIAIAGMGADNIIEIVNQNINKLVFIDHIIVDSHTKTYEIRHFFVNLGYKIDKEVIILEDNVFYEIIRFSKGNEIYSELDFKYGPLLRKNKTQIFIDYYKQQIEKINNILLNIDSDLKRKNELINSLSEINGMLKDS